MHENRTLFELARVAINRSTMTAMINGTYFFNGNFPNIIVKAQKSFAFISFCDGGHCTKSFHLC